METRQEFSGSEGSDEMEENQEERIEELCKTINEKPFNYDSHVELIQLLRNAADLDRLRMHRELMSSYFSLSFEQWSEWIDDELAIDLSLEKSSAFNLFSRAFEDCPFDVKLWQKFVTLAMEICDPATLESIMRKAIDTFSHDISNCHVFYHLELERLQSIPNSEERVRKLFLELLRLPHSMHEESLELYRQWKLSTTLNDPRQIESAIQWIVNDGGYGVAKSVYEQLLPFEQYLVESYYSETALQAYIQFLSQKQKKLSWMYGKSIYERSLLVNNLSPQLWLNYVEYLLCAQKHSEAVSVSKRAIKNVTWSADLWILFLRYSELSSSYSDMQQLLEKAFLAFQAVMATDLEGLVQLCLYKCSYARRHGESMQVFEQCITLIKKYHPSGDPYYRLEKFHAESTALSGNYEEGCRIWRTLILSTMEAKNQSELWRQFIRFITIFSKYNTLEIRKIYREALTEKSVGFMDWPESLIVDWRQFEFQMGDSQSINECYDICVILNGKIQLRRLREAVSASVAAAQQAKVTKEQQLAKDESHEMRSTAKQDSDHGSGKRHAFERNEDDQHSVDLKKSRTREPKSYVQIDPAKIPFTVFVSNLPRAITEDTLKTIFSEIGAITSLRLVKDFEHRKTFAYVEYDSVDAARRAIQKDRSIEIPGDRPGSVKNIFISAYVSNATEPATMNTLYLSNLPAAVTEEQLRTVFQQYGDIAAIRLKNHPKLFEQGKKPFAYVEFVNSDSAQSGLTMNNHSIDGTPDTIRVQLSTRREPPPRIKREPREPSELRQARQQPQPVLLMPRGMKKQMIMPSVPQHANSEMEGVTMTSAPKSNQDFRSMLLGKRA